MTHPDVAGAGHQVEWLFEALAGGFDLLVNPGMDFGQEMGEVEGGGHGASYCWLCVWAL